MTQQTPYIGSRISLISKLDIRYEGILYTVDTNESTIALAKVQSFGTEDRPTANPVAGRDEIYEYIIFKASDIKDLIVCETPKPIAQLSGLAYDPAIITISQHHAAAPQQSTPTTGGTGTGGNEVSVTSSRSGTPDHATPPAEISGSQISRAPGTGRNQRSGSLPKQQQSQQPKNRGGFQQQIKVTNSGQQQPPRIQSGYNNRQQQGTFYQGSQPLGSYRSALTGGHQGGFAQQSYHSGQRGSGQMGGAGVGYYRGVNMGSQRCAPHRGQSKSQNAKDRLKFESDYDFEKANQQFQETLNNITDDLKSTKLVDGDISGAMPEKNMEKAKEAGENEGTQSKNENGEKMVEPTFYDKSSSFFDRISCEALEKQEGRQTRPDWRKERETNQETFGHSAVRSLAYRRGGRGYGSGRGYRGGNMYRYNGYNYGQQRGGYGYFPNGYNRRGYNRNNYAGGDEYGQ
ncbi:hypothetical protein AB6A40_005011 [Gnathostoma spinigerum]|uniref:Uncharacterized protein n=1 Tax=Gnathostoma spinigerum TaxID=75299 RepID=A0ABD6ENQ5_9BILA